MSSCDVILICVDSDTAHIQKKRNLPNSQYEDRELLIFCKGTAAAEKIAIDKMIYDHLCSRNN